MGGAKGSQGGTSMATTYCWKGLNALFLLFVNILSYRYQRHNKNKADKKKSLSKLECEAELGCALSLTKSRIQLLVSKTRMN